MSAPLCEVCQRQPAVRPVNAPRLCLECLLFKRQQVAEGRRIARQKYAVQQAEAAELERFRATVSGLSATSDRVGEGEQPAEVKLATRTGAPRLAERADWKLIVKNVRKFERLVAEGKSRRSAAELCGVHLSTMKRWVKATQESDHAISSI